MWRHRLLRRRASSSITGVACFCLGVTVESASFATVNLLTAVSRNYIAIHQQNPRLEAGPYAMPASYGRGGSPCPPALHLASAEQSDGRARLVVHGPAPYQTA